MKKVGRAMLETFVGPCPKGMELCHGPNGKADDSLKNLCWGTRSKNMGEDRLRDGIDKRGEKHPLAKLNRRQVRKIRSLAGKVTYRKIAPQFNISWQLVGLIVNRINWAWLK